MRPPDRAAPPLRGAARPGARSSGCRSSIHTRAADEARPPRSDGFAGTVVLHCFSSRGCSTAALERGYYVSFAGNVTYPKARSSGGRGRIPADRILAETDSPYLAPQAVRGRPNEPANVVHTLACWPQRGARTRRARRPDRRERGSGLRSPVSVGPKKSARPALPRRREHPRRDRAARRARTGGHRARDRSRARSPHAYLAERVAHVHAVELDRALEPRLARASPAERTWRCISATLSRSTSPGSTAAEKLVANLPYNVATPLVVESLDGLPSVELWCVMVQREVADRFFAAPRTKAYGAVSVLDPARCRAHRLPSGLAHRLPAAAERRLGARRLPARPAAGPSSRGQARRRGAFAHRRKTLAELARARRARRARRAAAALEAIGRPAQTRAEALEPARVRRARPRRCGDPPPRRPRSISRSSSDRTAPTASTRS